MSSVSPSIPAADYRMNRTWTVLLAAVLAIGLAAWIACIAGKGDAGRAWRGLLIAFLFFTPMAIGMVTWTAVALASHGRWVGTAARPALAAIAWMPASILVFIVLWLGREHWAAWLHFDEMPKKLWLDERFVLLRDGAGLLAVWALALLFVIRRKAGRPAVLGGLLVFTYCIVFTLIGFDFVMAQDKHWYSALFGAYFFISGMYIAVAGWTLTAVLTGAGGGRSRLQDMGKLIVAFSLLTTYMMYSQLLPIWYEQLPDEVTFVIPRFTGLFRPMSMALLAVVYLGPLVLLLTRWSKRTPAFLGFIAALVLAGMWLERWWLIMPTAGFGPGIGIEEVSITAAMAAGFALCVRWQMTRLPASYPGEVG